jgi:CRISPR-associated protein Csd1
MSTITSPLAALAALHDRLAADPAWALAPDGYSPQKIAFAVVLSPEGKLVQIRDLRRLEKKKLLPEILIVPGGAKSTGSGLNPGFLWDNPAYLLGYTADRDAKKVARARKSFAAFRERHLAARTTVGAPEFHAVCTFLENWTPPDAAPADFLDDLAGGFGVFQIQAQIGYVHELPAVRRYWESLGSSEDVVTAQCLVTGEVAPIARTHDPKIKGVFGAQSAGAAIVSFNAAAYESYGQEQSFNAPVSVAAVRRYCTALNGLLAGSPQRAAQRLSLGDTTVVFWTARPTATETFFADAFGGVPPGGEEAQDVARLARVQQFLSTLRAGGGRAVPGDGAPDTPFYLLGLAPNAARLSIRFWQVSTLGDLAAKLAAHYKALSLVREYDDTARRPDPEFPTIRDLLDQTAAVRKDGVDRDTIPPLLGGALLRAVLTGAPYPHAFASAIVRRIRADGRLTYLRCAVLKAFLTRHLSITMNEALDPNRPESAYHLGRLFAVYETAQKHAHDWKLERTIRETMYSAASATPLAVFGRLERMFHHHTREKRFPPGSSETYAEIVGEICQRFTGSPIYPPALDLPKQAFFAVGYYHQLHHLRGLQEAKRAEALPAA